MKREVEDDKSIISRQLPIVEDDSHDRDSASPILTDGTFALRPESDQTGGLAYRVVQFGSDGGVDTLPHIVTSSHTSSPTLTNSGVTAATALVATTQFNGSPGSDGSGEARFAFIAPGGDGTGDASAVLTSGGQLYVIGNTTSVLTSTNQRSLTPRAGETTTMTTPRLVGHNRDEKRRVTHNEVERRRRDKINTWIGRLAKIIPDCPEAHTKNSHVLSKGGILSKACDYIQELRQQSEQLLERVKEHQQSQMDFELLKQEIEVLKNENAALKNENALMRAQLQQQGLLAHHLIIIHQAS
ncbi:upstream stimulatory factor 2-like isoform X2 [Oratosquilla oratoria]